MENLNAASIELVVKECPIVAKKCPAIGGFKPSGPIAYSAIESLFDMDEYFTLVELSNDRGAI